MIVMTNAGSAKLLGINPEVFKDNQLRQLSMISQSCTTALALLSDDDDRRVDLLATRMRADKAYDARYNELNRGWR